MSGADSASIFVTGATGVLGRPTVERLVAAGRRVVALARSEANESLLLRLGAVPARVDLFDRAGLEAALRGCGSVLHLATRIPPLRDATKRAAWDENDRIRMAGTRGLVDAALAAGARTLIYPSVCLFYPDGGDAWLEAAAPGSPPDLLRSTVVAESEVARFSASGGRGVVLRMGSFYGPSAPNTRDAVSLARKGVALLVGGPGAYVSSIWVDDAAAAVVAAERSAPAGIYDVVDDEPVTRGEMAGLMARTVGRRRLFRLPALLVRLTAGREALFAARSQRVSNRRFKEAAGWAPEVPSAREGWRRIGDSLTRGAARGVR